MSDTEPLCDAVLCAGAEVCSVLFSQGSEFQREEVSCSGTEGSALRELVQGGLRELDFLWLQNTDLAFETKTEADISETRLDGWDGNSGEMIMVGIKRKMKKGKPQCHEAWRN